MAFLDLMRKMTAAAVAGDGRGVAQCFTPDGTYHDVFYGAFTGHDAIADMIENHFHRDGEDFRWDLHDAVDDGAIGYVRYVFSYTSRLTDHAGRRSVFEAVSICRLRDGAIADYREVGNAAAGLSLMGFADRKIARFIAREAQALTARPEAAGHVSFKANRGERDE